MIGLAKWPPGLGAKPKRHADPLSCTMGFEYDKFKVQVKLAISRIVSLQQRHQNSLCGRRKEIADLLKAGQEERARLLVHFFCLYMPVGYMYGRLNIW